MELHDGSVPIWPAYQDDDAERHNSHAGFMQANGIHPDTVKSYWSWEPREHRWENLDRHSDSYRDLYDAAGEDPSGWYFGNLKTADDVGHLNIPNFRNVWQRIEKGPTWNAPAPTPEQAAQGKMCYFHPDKPAVAATGFAPMCADCYARYQNPRPAQPFAPAEQAQRNIQGPYPRQANDDPYYDPEFPDENQLDAEDAAWWDSIKPGSHQIDSVDALAPWHLGVEGKGLMTRDGKVLTWDNIGIHHNEVAQLLPRGPKDVHTFLDFIHPDGKVGMMDFDPALVEPLKKAGLHPYPLMSEGWDF